MRALAIIFLFVSLICKSQGFEEMTLEKYEAREFRNKLNDMLTISIECENIAGYANKISMSILLLVRFLPRQWPTVFIIPGAILQGTNLVLNEIVKSKIRRYENRRQNKKGGQAQNV